MGRLLKRLRLAVRFRVWPWRIPARAVTYLSLAGITKEDRERAAILFGWRKP